MAESVFEALRSARVWMVWKAEVKAGKAKPSKVPYYTDGVRRYGSLDSPQDRARLGTYEQAATAHATGAYDGLAIALGSDGCGGHFQGVDLDSLVINDLTDIADLWTRGACKGLGYVEMSPSGEGIHIIGYGRPFKSLGANATGIEAYAGGRYFTFTGKPILSDSPCVAYDLADYVEQVLTPRHDIGRASSELEAGQGVRVDPKTVTELRSALAFMRADDRELWIKMGHALFELGQQGRGLWIEWSQISEKYDALAAARAWDSFKPDKTGFKAVFAEAQRGGWTNPASKAANIGSILAPPDERRKLTGRVLAGVQMRAIDWLWQGWIPKGYITIFAGETGAGKSTVLADIAARITTGAAWPGTTAGHGENRKPGRVLWLGSEDGIEEMTVPRLTACRANLNLVVELQGAIQNGKRNTFSMQDDIEAVGGWLAFAKREGEPFDLLVIDPVTSYLPGQRLRKVDMNDAGQLRSILEPWLTFAQQNNIAIVCVTHFGKDVTRSMLHRVLGSAAFAQTCRSLIAVMDRPATRDYEPEPNEKLMMQVKVNLPDRPDGTWKFFTEKVEVGFDSRNSKPIYATRPAWHSIDGTLTPSSFNEQGSKTIKENPFGIWIKMKFLQHPPGHWLPVNDVKWSAIKDNAATENWWNKHAGEFLERENRGGEWYCRLKL